MSLQRFVDFNCLNADCIHMMLYSHAGRYDWAIKEKYSAHTTYLFTAVQVRPKRIFRRDAVNYTSNRLVYCVHRRRSGQVCYTAVYNSLFGMSD